MPTILVVDDSAVDRKIIRGLLENQSNWQVEDAIHGVEALEKLEEHSIDLVVSDLMMPQMDGLELVRRVSESFPLIPVILATSQGNEEIAVEALQSGAASYTPKSSMARVLIPTIESVLSLSTQQRNEARLVKCLTRSESHFTLDNDASLIPALVCMLQDDATRIGICDAADRTRLGVALDEALANALFHGNLELSSQQRDNDPEGYRNLMSQRLASEPFCDRRIHVTATFTDESASFVIRDEGPGFDPSTLPDPRDPANLENLGGRGVLLMRTFMDEIGFNDQGNEVTLIKRSDAEIAVCAGEGAE